MKKLLFVFLALVLVFALMGTPIMAKGGAPELNGKSMTGNVSLVQKDSTTWDLVPDGAWGQFNYKLSDTGDVEGVFNGEGLDDGEDYSLIYYPETVDNPWTSPPVVIVLGDGTANEDGDVHIMGAGELDEPDQQPLGGDYDYQLGDKIWLVLADDLDDSNPENITMIAWNPDDYLFETSLINTALLLIEKDPIDWSKVDNGAWGSFDYVLSKGGKVTEVSGVFKGYGLTVGESYSLIYYPETVDDPWTSPPEVVVLGNDMASGALGEITINVTGEVIGKPDTQPTDGDYEGQTGDKIWLVLSDDLDDDEMIDWTPSAYLFECNLINAGK